jgi:glycerophosphoryl diester phosphodiesterase
VPTFAEVLEICRGRIGVLIDNKAGTPSKVAEAVRVAGMVDEVVVYGGVEELRVFQRCQPRLKIQPPHPDSSEAMKTLLSTLRPETVDGRVTEWNEIDVALCRKAKVEIWVDVLGDSDSEEGYRRAIELGVDVIQTDYPIKAKRFLEMN